MIRYTVGNYATFIEADFAKEEVQTLGYPDAWVVAYKNGVRMSTTQARIETGNIATSIEQLTDTVVTVINDSTIISWIPAFDPNSIQIEVPDINNLNLNDIPKEYIPYKITAGEQELIGFTKDQAKIMLKGFSYKNWAHNFRLQAIQEIQKRDTLLAQAKDVIEADQSILARKDSQLRKKDDIIDEKDTQLALSEDEAKKYRNGGIVWKVISGVLGGYIIYHQIDKH